MSVYGGGDCMSTADSCLLVLVGTIGILSGVSYGIFKVIQTLIA